MRLGSSNDIRPPHRRAETTRSGSYEGSVDVHVFSAVCNAIAARAAAASGSSTALRSTRQVATASSCQGQSESLSSPDPLSTRCCEVSKPLQHNKSNAGQSSVLQRAASARLIVH